MIRKNMWIDWIVMLIILAFIILWLFKINGYFDFSGKYNIEDLYANKENYNIQLLLDDEDQTKWGELSKHEIGDYISVGFRKGVYVSQIILIGKKENIPEALKFQTQMDGQTIELSVEKKSRNRYNIISDIAVDNIQIKISEGNKENEDIKWIMSEIQFVFREK